MENVEYINVCILSAKTDPTLATISSLKYIRTCKHNSIIYLNTHMYIRGHANTHFINRWWIILMLWCAWTHVQQTADHMSLISFQEIRFFKSSANSHFGEDSLWQNASSQDWAYIWAPLCDFWIDWGSKGGWSQFNHVAPLWHNAR